MRSALMKHFRLDEAALGEALALFVDRPDYGFIWLAYEEGDTRRVHFRLVRDLDRDRWRLGATARPVGRCKPAPPRPRYGAHHDASRAARATRDHPDRRGAPRRRAAARIFHRPRLYGYRRHTLQSAPLTPRSTSASMTRARRPWAARKSRSASIDRHRAAPSRPRPSPNRRTARAGRAHRRRGRQARARAARCARAASRWSRRRRPCGSRRSSRAESSPRSRSH